MLTIKLAFPVEEGTKDKGQVGDIATHKVISYVVNSEQSTLRKVSPSITSYKPFIKVPLLLLMGLCSSIYFLELLSWLLSKELRLFCKFICRLKINIGSSASNMCVFDGTI